MMAASGKGNIECVKVILAAGANALHKNVAGHTALDFAIDLKHPAVVAVLQAHLAQLDAKAEGEEEGK